MRGLVLWSILAIASTTNHSMATPRWQTLPLPPEMPLPDAKGHVDAKPARIYFASFGKGEPVILLHGGLGNGDHWAFQVPELAKRYRVITIDSRNQGRSGFSKDKLTYHAMAGDVLAVMDALDLKRAAIVGWSDGGAIGLDLAINHPQRVAKLFVYGTNYDANGSKPRRANATFNQYAAKCKHDFDRFARDNGSYSEVVDSLLPVWRSQGGFTKDQLRGIKVPTVIADGDNDELIHLDHIKEMAGLVPNAKLVVFKDTSHFALWQDPASFNRAVLEFLASK